VDDDFDNHLDPDTLRFIRQKACQIAGRYGFSRDEVDDISQSLIVACIPRFAHFSSSRGSRHHFIRSVVNHAVATLIETRRATRRGHTLCHISVDASSSHDSKDTGTVSNSISEDRYHDRMGGGAKPFERLVHLRLDVEDAIAALPAELERVCRLLMVFNHVAQVAHVIGISRATLYRRVCAIREVFVRAQLCRYAERQEP
jgi:RNA polymerase sigma-70 factor (ECF subfamily)